MRTRLTPSLRRQAILQQARQLFLSQGYAMTEMEDIRKACKLSRGGLYHHFDNKATILDALVRSEVQRLSERLEVDDGDPIAALFRAGSTLLGADPGIVCALHSAEARALYLDSLDRALEELLGPVLAACLVGRVRPDVHPDDVAELLLTVNNHINRRTLLGSWSETRTRRFAGMALRGLIPLLTDKTLPDELIATIEHGGAPS